MARVDKLHVPWQPEESPSDRMGSSVRQPDRFQSWTVLHSKQIAGNGGYGKFQLFEQLIVPIIHPKLVMGGDFLQTTRGYGAHDIPGYLVLTNAQSCCHFCA
jgi:hypothetical protein